MLPSALLAAAVRLIGVYVAVVAVGHLRFADGAVSVAVTGRDAYLLLAALGAAGAIFGLAAAAGLWLRRGWGGYLAAAWAVTSVGRDVGFVVATSPDDPLAMLLFAPRWVAFVVAGVVAWRYAAPRPAAPAAPVGGNAAGNAGGPALVAG